VDLGVGVKEVFDHDLVLPVIAEVVGVAEPVADPALISSPRLTRRSSV
jgi:hypothetical protein